MEVSIPARMVTLDPSSVRRGCVTEPLTSAGDDKVFLANVQRFADLVEENPLDHRIWWSEAA